MQIFHCERCGTVVSFSTPSCPHCGSQLGYVPTERTLRVLARTDDPASYVIDGAERPVWRCLNSAWGCNWVVPARSDNVWCRSCQLTRGRPDEANPAAVEAWMIAESAKRRLVYQLDGIGLPIDVRSDAVPDGLAFDLVHIPGEGGITGHLDGVVTLDLAETDDGRRDELRRRLGETFRTVIGHLRHEIGHHYWARLVAGSDARAHFRSLFGDERIDYARAVERHYASATGEWDRTQFVTSYAASHPLEDWAETFAHYLHIIDIVDTAVAHDLIPSDSSPVLVADVIGTLDLGGILDAWRPVNVAVNAIAETLGVPAVYPFDPTGAVVDKLAFVHRRIAACVERVDAGALDT